MLGYIQRPAGEAVPANSAKKAAWPGQLIDFIQALKDKGWPVTAVDLGDLARVLRPRNSVSNMSIYSMKAAFRSLADYQTIGMGKNGST